MIIEEYDESLFIQRFENMNRVETTENPNGNFSYKGLGFLFEHIDEGHEEENPFKLDVISLCCDFSEYKNLEEYLKQGYNHSERKDFDSDEDFYNAIEEEINDNTILIKFDDSLDEGFITQNY